MENAEGHHAESTEYVTLSTSLANLDFDGYSIRVRDNTTGETLHVASGEVHTLEALGSIVTAATEYRRGSSTVELTLGDSKKGLTYVIDPDMVTHPLLLGVPSEVVEHGVDGYAMDFVDAEGAVEPGGRGELPSLSSGGLGSMQIVAQAGSKYARESGKQVKLRVFNSKTGLDQDVHVVDGR